MPRSLALLQHRLCPVVFILVVRAAATVGAIHHGLQWFCGRYWLQTISDALHTVTVLDNVALSAIHTSVPPVFDSVVTPVSQPPCDLSPPLPHVVHHALYQLALL